ncbi:MAG: TadE/TadG family type IV pilus assembly protein [Planctomycetota bacterium]
MKTVKNISRKHIRYRGAAIVEAAIVITLLIMLTLGLMAFGYIFLRAQHVTFLARHGARVASRWGANSGTVTAELAPLMRPDETITQINIGPDTGNPVTVTVQGTGLDVMNLGGFLTSEPGNPGTPIPDSYSASVTMPKEGP